METLTTTIKREYLREIVARRKRIEYREIKPYWENRLRTVSTPFRLRLINGMSKNAPEVTLIVREVVRDRRNGTFDLHLGRIVDVKNWDRRREEPTRKKSTKRARKQRVLRAPGALRTRTANVHTAPHPLRERLRRFTDKALVDAFNREVGNPGWTSSRTQYLVAMHDEFIRRGFDYSAVGDNEGLSLRAAAKLVKKKIVVASLANRRR